MMIGLVLGLIAWGVAMPAAGRTEDTYALAFVIAQKISDGLDRDQSRAHVHELRTALEAALDKKMRLDRAFAQGRSGDPYSAVHAYELLGELSVLEGRPSEAAAFFAQGAALTGINPEKRRQFMLARASALALDGRFEAARALRIASNCDQRLSCSDDNWCRATGSALLDSHTLARGPIGICTAQIVETTALYADALSLDYLVEPYRRLAIEAARGTPRGTPGRGHALLVPTVNLATWLTKRGRDADATALKADMETDEDYLVAREARLGVPLDHRTARRGRETAPGVAPTRDNATRLARRTSEAIDADIAKINSQLFYWLNEGGGGIQPSPMQALIIAEASRELSQLYRERGDLQRAEEHSENAFVYMTMGTPPHTPLKADLGPRAPGCPPGRMEGRACQHWYPDSIERYANLDVARLLADRSALEADAGRMEEALRIDGFAATVEAHWLQRNWSQSEDVAEAMLAHADVNARRLAVLAKMRESPNLGGSAERQAFAVAQLLQITSVDAAVRKATIRRHAESEAHKALLQQWQRLSDERRLAREPARIEALASEIAAIEARLPFAVSALERGAGFLPFPLEDARKMLRQDEALLVILPLIDRTEVFAVTGDTVRWATADVSDAWIAARVAALRAHLDADNASAPAFNRTAAYELHAALIAPVADALEGKLIFASVSGALDRLPLGVLVRKRPAGADDDSGALQATAWLAQNHAIVTLPSVGALASLRVRPPSLPRTAMIGFGGVPARGGAQMEALRNSLGALPHSRQEIEDLARYHHGTPVLDRDATEARLRASDLTGVGILAFATHGVAGGPHNEPGLVLALGNGGTDDDGFLTASEVASLDIDADIVVLSACNTAGGDGKGGEVLSGLAQSFLFAGSRTVLATHWPVADEAALVLMVETLSLDNSDAVAVARRLQAAIVRYIANSAGTVRSDPRWWGPYVVVGG